MAGYDALAPYEGYILKASKKYNVDPQLIRNVIMRESSGRSEAASGTGPVGLMQISKALAKDYGYSESDRLDPEKNIEMGVKYLASNLKEFNGDTAKALVGYNLGTGGAHNYFAGKTNYGTAPQDYLNSSYFKEYTGNNPVSKLPTAQQPLQGEALITSSPQSPEEAEKNATRPALMGSDELTKEESMSRADQARQEYADNLRAMQEATNNKEEEQKKNRDMIYSTALNGLAGVIAGLGGKSSSESHTEFTHFYRPQWGAPTEESLSRINNFGSMRNMLGR